MDQQLGVGGKEGAKETSGISRLLGAEKLQSLRAPITHATFTILTIGVHVSVCHGPYHWHWPLTPSYAVSNVYKSTLFSYQQKFAAMLPVSVSTIELDIIYIISSSMVSTVNIQRSRS